MSDMPKRLHASSYAEEEVNEVGALEAEIQRIKFLLEKQPSCTDYEELKAENKRLKEFARKCIRECCWNMFASEPDSVTIHDLAEKLGLIEPHTATEDDAVLTDYDVGDIIYLFSQVLKG